MQVLPSLRAFTTKRGLSMAGRIPSRSFSTPLRRPAMRLQLQPIPTRLSQSRCNSSLTIPDDGVSKANPSRPQEPSYQLTFTCKPCSNRSAHIVTKHGYHKGTVLVTCPQCKGRHVISDHLKIFMDEKSTLEDILARKAGTDGDLTKLLKKGKLGMRQGEIVGREGDEDIEFWDDGTETQHKPAHAPTS